MTRETRTPTSVVGNRYELDGVLGRGSMGTVYRARDVVLDRHVAVKLFPAASADGAQAVRYEHEARLLARLNHPGLVTVYDAGIDATVAAEPRPYLVMELIHGRTLSDRLREGALPISDVAELAMQLAPALEHIHQRGVVHRDIKPANIMLAGGGDEGAVGTVTLTDFGIARLVDGTRITAAGYTIGTANYLSPEQLNGGEVGPASDVYSLGLVLLECMTGVPAFPGVGAEAALPRLHRSPEIPPSVPPGWAQLLAAMTGVGPEARPSAAHVAARVAELADRRSALVAPAAALAQTSVLPTVPSPVTHRRGRLRPAVLLVGAALAVLVMIVVLALASSSDTGSPPAPTPGYPSVGGQLGSHLRQLQQDVQP